MKLAKVVGKVIAPRKVMNTEGRKLLIVEYLNECLQPTGKTAACIDSVNAGSGDIVLLVASSSARMTAITRDVCTDHTIIGVVDMVSSGKQNLYKRE